MHVSTVCIVYVQILYVTCDVSHLAHVLFPLLSPVNSCSLCCPLGPSGFLHK